MILFVAWLMAYVLEPPVTWLARHMPFHSRGLAVAVTYLIAVLVTFGVLLGAGAALLSAAVKFVEQLPAFVERARAGAATRGVARAHPPAPVDLAARSPLR